GQAFHGLRPRRAVLVAGGTADTTVLFDRDPAPLFAALPAPAFLVKIVGGTHSGFTDMDSRLSAEQLARQQALTRRYATAFLRRILPATGASRASSRRRTRWRRGRTSS